MPLPSERVIKNNKEETNNTNERDLKMPPKEVRAEKLKGFLKKYNTGDTEAQVFKEMDSNVYRPTGMFMFDYVIMRKGMKFPTKMLVYGRNHIGKTSFITAIMSRYMDRYDSAFCALLDLDRTIDKEYVEKSHQMTGDKAERYVYTKARDAESAIAMIEDGLKEKIFDIIGFDPWNMVARADDVDKSGHKLIGQTRMADRAGVNSDFFRTKGHLIDQSGAALFFSEHESMSQMGTKGFAGGEALKGSLELTLFMKTPFGSGYNKVEDKEDGGLLVRPIEFVVEKNKFNSNLKCKYIMYFHKKKGFLSEYDKFAFLDHKNVVKSSGSWKYLDAPGLGSGKKFYFSQWEDFYEKNKSEIIDLCNELVKQGLEDD